MHGEEDELDPGEVNVGMVAGLMGCFQALEGATLHPLDVAAVHQHMATTGSKASKMGTFSYMNHLRATEGIGALYRGFGTHIAGILPHDMVRLSRLAERCLLHAATHCPRQLV